MDPFWEHFWQHFGALSRSKFKPFFDALLDHFGAHLGGSEAQKVW